MAARQLVVFRIDDEEFGVDVSQVNIIERRMDIFKVPNTQEFVEGLINLRGKVYTVFNMRKRFGIPAKEYDENTKIIMVSTASAVVGLIVDSVNEIVKIEDDSIEAAPAVLEDKKRKFITSIAKMDNRIIMLLDIENVLSLEELARV